ncbi:MAG: hypothetical protein ABIG84_06730 [archaeon]
MKRFVLVEVKKPRNSELESDIEWMCECLGIITPRDRERTSTKILTVMLRAAKDDVPLSSDDIANRVGITRGTAVHHIKRYMGSGIIVKHRSAYELRTHSLRETLDEIELDMERTIKRMKQIAEQIDEEMGLRDD